MRGYKILKFVFSGARFAYAMSCRWLEQDLRKTYSRRLVHNEYVQKQDYNFEIK